MGKDSKHSLWEMDKYPDFCFVLHCFIISLPSRDWFLSSFGHVCCEDRMRHSYTKAPGNGDAIIEISHYRNIELVCASQDIQVLDLGRCGTLQVSLLIPYFTLLYR